MTKKSDTSYQRGIFTVREWNGISGFVEISITTAELLPGAGPILRGMICRQPGHNCKFVGYTSRRNRVAIGRRKETVIEATIAEIEIDMRQDGSMKFYTKTALERAAERIADSLGSKERAVTVATGITHSNASHQS